MQVFYNFNFHGYKGNLKGNKIKSTKSNNGLKMNELDFSLTRRLLCIVLVLLLILLFKKWHSNEEIDATI